MISLLTKIKNNLLKGQKNHCFGKTVVVNNFLRELENPANGKNEFVVSRIKILNFASNSNAIA